MPVDGRRPGAPSITIAPASPNSRARPGPAATATIRRPARSSARLRGRLDLLGEVGDPDPVGTPGADARPRSPPRRRRRGRGRSTAPRRRPRRASRRAGPSVALEPLRPPPGRRSRGGTSPRRTGRRGRGRRPARALAGTGIVRRADRGQRAIRRRPVSTDSAASRTTQSPRPPASTTPASRSCRSCSGVCRQRLAGSLGGRGEDVASPGTGLGGAAYGGVGGGAGDGQDRALDRRTDRGVARVGGLAHGLGHHRGVALLGRGAGDPDRDRAEHLAEDDAAVAAGAEQGAPRGTP